MNVGNAGQSVRGRESEPSSRGLLLIDLVYTYFWLFRRYEKKENGIFSNRESRGKQGQ